MMHYRCKCGKSKAFGSDHPRPCQGCHECGTTLAMHPDHHKAVEPHDLKLYYSQQTGKPSHYRCKLCMEKVALDDSHPD